MIDTVDAYLDRLFDLLAGTGAAGRRTLQEAQAHLEEDVEHALARGHLRSDAERNAIARFGAPETIANEHLRAKALPVQATLHRVGAAAWLMTGVAGAAIGLMGVFNALLAHFVSPTFITDDNPDTLYTIHRCRELGVWSGDQVTCRAASVAHHVEELTYRPIVIGALGLLLLALFVAAQRRPTLRKLTHLPSAAMLSSAGAVAFGGTGLAFVLYGLIGIAVGEYVEVGAHLASGLAALCAGAFFLPRAWREVSVRPV